jgi:hypothetical protein
MLLFALLPATLAADPAPKAELVSVAKIWDQAAHNAFTDLIRFRDRWYCTFREGVKHAGDPGAIRILVSADGAKWESIAHMAKPGEDYRDPKLAITPDGKLMLVAASAVPATRDPLTDHYSFVCFSADGKTWTEPKKVVSSWQWLWRVTWHEGAAYGVGYSWDDKSPREDKKRSAILFRSKDGVSFEKLADFALKNPSEATLRFAGDTLLCLQRRDGEPNTAMLGTSKAPFKEWQWQDLGMYFGGPNFLQLPDGTWWAVGRRIADKKAETIVCRFDVKAGKLEHVLTLPSSGDTSYAGLVWHEGQLWISYYSTHEKKTSIYLARVKIGS